MNGALKEGPKSGDAEGDSCIGIVFLMAPSGSNATLMLRLEAIFFVSVPHFNRDTLRNARPLSLCGRRKKLGIFPPALLSNRNLSC